MDDSSPLSLLFRLALSAGVIFIAYMLVFGRRADFVIEVRRGEVRYKGKVPQAVLHELTPFLLEDLGIRDSVRILGSLHGKRIRVWFRGRIDRGKQQRIRNFLTNG
jgi:hypothetical protein